VIVIASEDYQSNQHTERDGRKRCRAFQPHGRQIEKLSQGSQRGFLLRRCRCRDETGEGFVTPRPNRLTHDTQRLNFLTRTVALLQVKLEVTRLGIVGFAVEERDLI